MAAMSTILKIFKYLLPDRKLDWVETWWEALEQHRDSELLKSFHSDIQDDHHDGHFENLQTASALEWYVRLSQKLVGSIGVTWRFRIAKFIMFQYPRWLPWWPSWKPWNDICSWTVRWIKLKLGQRHWGDMEIQNCQTDSIAISKMAAMAAKLKFFKTRLLPKRNVDLAQTWMEAS